eukprot:CAMPEP_0195031448 /NCGR_PEP_ID=MMETSP0326_2-20130528/61240_1 /TAXON_ID=2866 ORGANISM="Crypthecodinium cohnii, Strain Seligo" /NCGR_SAMPLE_ID=MMETSP0326_2 /ASSEMBLY_ACC=CAM_ASM_000348 /LENGTH=47 /DNA_ID= /DNA_START= /DNA_END= /DNA_ORIENTATION=
MSTKNAVLHENVLHSIGCLLGKLESVVPEAVTISMDQHHASLWEDAP